MHIKNVACTGHEARLVDCPYSRDTAINNHAKDVSILCQQRKSTLYSMIHLMFINP